MSSHFTLLKSISIRISVTEKLKTYVMIGMSIRIGDGNITYSKKNSPIKVHLIYFIVERVVKESSRYKFFYTNILRHVY